jgi:hypothetical protein
LAMITGGASSKRLGSPGAMLMWMIRTGWVRCLPTFSSAIRAASGQSVVASVRRPKVILHPTVYSSEVQQPGHTAVALRNCGQPEQPGRAATGPGLCRQFASKCFRHRARYVPDWRVNRGDSR